MVFSEVLRADADVTYLNSDVFLWSESISFTRQCYEAETGLALSEFDGTEPERHCQSSD